MKDLHKNKRGFSLIEIMVVLGIFSIIATFSLFASMDFWRSSSFRGERNLIVGILQKARSESMSNINELPHGVHIDPNQYVLFEGNTYNPLDPKNEKHEANPSISHSGMTEVIYDRLSGKAITVGGSLVLSQGSNQSVISINNEGQINWTN